MICTHVYFWESEAAGLRKDAFSDSIFSCCALSHGCFPQLGGKDRRVRHRQAVSDRFNGLPDEATPVLELEFDAHLPVSGRAVRSVRRCRGWRQDCLLDLAPRATDLKRGTILEEYEMSLFAARTA